MANLKKATAMALAFAMTVTSTTFAAMPNGTVAIGNKAFDLEYANAAQNQAEMTQAVVESQGKVFVKNFAGQWVNNDNTPASAAQIPAVTYKNKDGVTTNYAPGDTEQAAQRYADLKYSDADGVLKADGASSTLVTFELKDAQGNLMTSAEDVVVAFTSTFGNFAEKRVTVQKGVATVMFTSEALTVIRIADLVGTVVEAKDGSLIGIKAGKSITLDPNPDGGQGDTTGARVTEAEAAQADRIVLYFNKDVSVSNYVNSVTGLIDAKKASIIVTKNVDNDLDTTGHPVVDVKGFMPVPGNSKALFAILDKADLDFPLDDNAKVIVEFKDKTGTVEVPSKVNFNLTDARKPELIRVDREGLKTIKVTFSEPVTDMTGLISAENLGNWSIDGKLLNNDAWGVAATRATATVGEFDPKTGEDTRNVVTITLGKKANGDQIYFGQGTHSVQAASIGDWAAESDTLNNKMNTQTLDFEIPADTEVPVATVEVQSPEQWLVTYNKDVVETAAAFAAKLKLQKYDTKTSKWVDDANVASYGTAKVNDNNLNLVVTKVENNKFLIETDKDWTNVYNTKTTNKNYYNDQYRLSIPADTVTNPSNGKKNAAQDLELNDTMDAPDVTSPVISMLSETPNAAKGTSYDVIMSEPVKLNTGANAEGATDSQGQKYNDVSETWGNIPVPTARFIKKDNSVTIPGTIGNVFIDPAPGTEYDRILTITPDKTLTAGDWILSVESISDDIGNTAATVTKEFNVAGTVTTTDFEVLWAYADKDYETLLATGSEYDKDNVDAGANKDAIYVKFSKPVKITGDFISALETQNYTVNGKALPDGTQIIADIAGYDDADSVVDSVTIMLPDNTITDVEKTVLNITHFIESADGETLKNPGEKKLSYNYSLFASPAANTATTVVVNNDGTRKVTFRLNAVSNPSRYIVTYNGATYLADENGNFTIDGLTAEQVETLLDEITVEVKLTQAALESIAVTTPPTKVTYTVGDTFDAAGLVVTATYEDNATAAVNGYTLSEPDMSTAGTKTVTVTYQGETATFNITVNAAQATLESIAVTTPPTKVTYTVGDAFDAAGLVVTATYSDNSTSAVNGYTLSEPDMSTAGTKTVTVTYQGETATFDITVEEAQQQSYTVNVTDFDPNFLMTVAGTIVADPVVDYTTLKVRVYDAMVVAGTVTPIGNAVATLDVAADGTFSGTIPSTTFGYGFELFDGTSVVKPIAELKTNSVK